MVDQGGELPDLLAHSLVGAQLPNETDYFAVHEEGVPVGGIRSLLRQRALNGRKPVGGEIGECECERADACGTGHAGK
jgi:hypothetical protein